MTCSKNNPISTTVPCSLQLDDDEHPLGKNESILGVCLRAYALSLNNENELGVSKSFETPNYNEIMCYAEILLRGKGSVSYIFDKIPKSEHGVFWNKIKTARERELYLELDKNPYDDVLEADISLELFDLNLLETYLNEVYVINN